MRTHPPHPSSPRCRGPRDAGGAVDRPGAVATARQRTGRRSRKWTTGATSEAALPVQRHRGRRLHVGTCATQNFGASLVYGVRLGYAITEDFFVEGAYAQTSVTDDSFRQILPGGIFADKTETLSHHNLSVGYNVLPGEVFLGRSRADAVGAVPDRRHRQHRLRRPAQPDLQPRPGLSRLPRRLGRCRSTCATTSSLDLLGGARASKQPRVHRRRDLYFLNGRPAESRSLTLHRCASRRRCAAACVCRRSHRPPSRPAPGTGLHAAHTGWPRTCACRSSAGRSSWSTSTPGAGRAARRCRTWRGCTRSTAPRASCCCWHQRRRRREEGPPNSRPSSD